MKLALLTAFVALPAFAQSGSGEVTVQITPVQVSRATVTFAPELKDLELPMDLTESARFPERFEATVDHNKQTPVSDYCAVVDRHLSVTEVVRELGCRFPMKNVDLRRDLPPFSEITKVEAKKKSIERYGWGGDRYFVWPFHPKAENGYDVRVKLDALFFDVRKFYVSRGDIAQVNRELATSYQQWRVDYIKAYNDGTLKENARNEFSFEIR